jgi:hypothetical protein
MIDELAGIASCDPEPLTLRRLLWRAEAVQRSAWGQTAPVLSMLEACRQQNVAFDPNKWNPYAIQKEKTPGRSTPEERRAFAAALKAGENVRVGASR